MEHLCTGCFVVHLRPSGRRCPRVSKGMATNMTQAPLTATETLTSNVATTTHVAVSTASEGAIASTSQSQQTPPVRTDDLILAELRQLSSRIAHVEQEMLVTSRTSTPRKKKLSAETKITRGLGSQRIPRLP